MYHHYGNTCVSYCDASIDSAGKIITNNIPTSEANKDIEGEKLKVQTGENEKKQVLAGIEEKAKEQEEEEGPLFHNLFPQRQLWKPTLEYPLWDEDWDGRKMKGTGDAEKDLKMKRSVRKHGVTKHIILIRHGQYDEQHKVNNFLFLSHLNLSLLTDSLLISN